MDKFGYNPRNRVSLRQMLLDLDMNDNRITNLGYPKDSSDAVTKGWMTQQLMDGIKDIHELKTALEEISKEHEAEKKCLNGIEKDVAKCLPSTGGRVNCKIDMRGHPIINLPTPKSADELVTGWYAKNWQELVMNLTGKINDLEKKIKGGRLRRELDFVSEEDKHIDRIKELLG